MLATADRYRPPTIAQRGKVAKAMATVHAHKPQHGETSGFIPCPACGGRLRFNIQSTGLSRGNCACGIRWAQ